MEIVPSGRPRKTVFLIHGILSNGQWHKNVSDILKHFYQCRSLRYREYHAFGPVNLFFWPWSLFLATLLGWLATRRLYDTDQFWIVLSATGLLLGAALVEAWFSGFARTLCWLIVGSVWFGATGELRTLYTTIGALVLVGFVSWHRTDAERRYIAYWIVAFIALVGLWGLGRLATTFSEQDVMATCLVVLGLYLAYCELNWKGVNVAVVVPLLVTFGSIGFLLGRFPAEQLYLLWSGMLVLMLCQEYLEVRDNRIWDFPWLIVVVAVVVVAALGWWLTSLYPASAFAFAAVLLIVGWLEPKRRMERATNRIIRLIEKTQADPSVLPHSWIAHSLGVFLTGKGLQAHMVPLDRLVLVGGALSETYDWSPLMEGDAPSIKQIRNEHGSLDAVIQLLWSSGKWAAKQGLGGAGWVGLRPQNLPVHDVKNHRIRCPQCDTDGEEARIHNYELKGFAHSTYFLRRQHAEAFWLPYLLGHTPEDVNGFYRKCQQLLAEYHERNNDPFTYQKSLNEFLETEYNWFSFQGGRKSFAAWVDQFVPQISFLEQTYTGLDVPVRRVIQEAAALLVSNAVYLALKEKQKAADQRDPLVLKSLNPVLVVQDYAREACKRIAKSLKDGWRPAMEVV